MRQPFKWILMALFALVFVACGSDSEMNHGEMVHSEMDMSGEERPDNLDESLSKMTNDGAFMVELRPMEEPIPLNEVHTWELHVEDGSGNPIDGATVTIGGGMPEHGHGFPTEPSVSATDEMGVYLVEGMKYQMSGWWEMAFEISADSTTDSVTFNVVLP